MIWAVDVGAGITNCKVVLSQSDLKHSATWDETTYWLTKILISNSARHYHRERNVANNIFSQILFLKKGFTVLCSDVQKTAGKVERQLEDL